MPRVSIWLTLGLAGLATGVAAQAPIRATSGSTAFCLFELPMDEGSRRRWINLGIVQYVDVGNGDVKLAFGGGNLGSGHEVRIPVATRDEALAFIDRMRQAAGECRRGGNGG